MPGGGVEDVDRAGAGAARRAAVEKPGAGGLRLQVKYNAVYHLLVERRPHGPYPWPVEHGRLYTS